MPTITADDLHDLTTRVLTAAGADERNAVRVADALVLSNLSGVDTHGVFHLPRYVTEIRDGTVVPHRVAGDRLRDAHLRARLRQLDLRPRRCEVRHGCGNSQGARPEHGDGQPRAGDPHRPGGRVRRDGRGGGHGRPRVGVRLRRRGARGGPVRRDASRCFTPTRSP